MAVAAIARILHCTLQQVLGEPQGTWGELRVYDSFCLPQCRLQPSKNPTGGRGACNRACCKPGACHVGFPLDWFPPLRSPAARTRPPWEVAGQLTALAIPALPTDALAMAALCADSGAVRVGHAKSLGLGSGTTQTFVAGIAPQQLWGEHASLALRFPGLTGVKLDEELEVVGVPSADRSAAATRSVSC